MMAMSEEPRDEGRAATVKKVALSLLLCLILLFSLGILTGAGFALLSGEADPGELPITLALAAVAAIAGVVAIVGLRRLKPWAGTGEPMSPKTRKANNLLLASAAIGGLLGGSLSLGAISMDDPFALFSNSEMPLAIVIPALAVWLLIVPLISWQWHRSIDEHEAEAYRIGGLAGLYLYAFLVPAWWFAWRGGLVPAPDTMAIYLVVMTVWGIGWFWRRYR